jgi:hypothetical protein
MKIIFISILILINVQLFIIIANSHCIEVFEHKDLKGKKLDVCIESNSKCYHLNSKWKNKVSSINTHNRCVVLYENNDCSGSHTKVAPGEIGGDYNNLEESSFDDKTSSVSFCEYLTQVVWYSLDGIDFAHSDAFYQKSNEKDCKERCLTDHQCKFIVVSSDGTECWGKYIGDYIVGKNNKRRVISYNNREFIHERGESYFGNDIAIIDNINENECKTICSIHPKCTAANFHQSESKCFIKNMDPIRINDDPNKIGIRDKDYIAFDSNSIILNSSVSKRSEECCSIDGFDFSGSDIFHQNSNETQCKDRCLNDLRCKFIIVSSDGTQCWGKYYGDYGMGKNHLRRAISKNKIEFIHERGESYYGHDIATIDNTNENECKAICGIHPKCTSANFHPSQRKCFIKNMNPIYIHYDPELIGIRKKDFDCKEFISKSSPHVYKRCIILTCDQNDLQNFDPNLCQNKGNQRGFFRIAPPFDLKIRYIFKNYIKREIK